MNSATKRTYRIDATGMVLGRLATEISFMLRGKNQPDYAPNKDAGVVVEIENLKKLKFTGNKFNDKIYYRYTRYLGGLKSATMKEVFAKDPRKILRAAVFGMLPTNKLRDVQIRRLKFKS